ncbi:hypothetical protein PIB30_069704 [Stylosanthes scabra]|uniref:Uncharacterized protein n=1 Tax=Stylosanthes scabra TaxID=79078 RepID=A0ABU6SNN8_9FABA|nr:hypothetical protein [Stylosanthes scabra]
MSQCRDHWLSHWISPMSQPDPTAPSLSTSHAPLRHWFRKYGQCRPLARDTTLNPPLCFTLRHWKEEIERGSYKHLVIRHCTYNLLNSYSNGNCSTLLWTEVCFVTGLNQIYNLHNNFIV